MKERLPFNASPDIANIFKPNMILLPIILNFISDNGGCTTEDMFQKWRDDWRIDFYLRDVCTHLTFLEMNGFIRRAGQTYFKNDISNFRQQSSTVFEICLPNPNEVDLIRCALAMVLEDFATIEIVQKCEMSKPDVSNMKAMKRAVSLEKALEIVSKMKASEKFVMLMSKLMEKKLQMMK